MLDKIVLDFEVKNKNNNNSDEININDTNIFFENILLQL